MKHFWFIFFSLSAISLPSDLCASEPDKAKPNIIFIINFLHVATAGALGRLAKHQRQMAILGSYVENFNIGVIISLDIEAFASRVLSDVDDDLTSSLPPAVPHQRAHLGTSAELLELLV